MADFNGGMANNGLETLLAQLRSQSNEEQSHSSPQQHQQMPGLLSQYNPYNHNPQGNHSFYGHHSQPAESPIANNGMDFPPAAPTPPTGAMFSTQHPPGFTMGGTSSGTNGQTTSLLNLLKFSGQGGQQSLSQTSTAPPTQLHRESLIRHASEQAANHTIHAPAPTSADPTGLLAALMKGKFQDEVKQEQQQQQQPQAQPQPPAPIWNAEPPENTQQYLLNLLNRPKPSQSDAPPSSDANKSASLTPQSQNVLVRHASTDDHAQETNTLEQILQAASVQQAHKPAPSVSTAVPTSSFDFEPKDSGSPQLKFEPSPAAPARTQDVTPSKSGLFTYSNPFEDLTSSPRDRTSKKSTPGASASPSIQILKKPGSTDTSLEHKRLGSSSSYIENRAHVRRKLEPTSSFQEPHIVDVTPPIGYDQDRTAGKETVAEAVSDIAGRVDREAQEAIARAEDEQSQARITRDLQNLMAASTVKEFETAASQAAFDIQQELKKDDNQGALEEAFEPEVAKAVRDIVDEAAQGPIVDSWESAEAEDEIVVIEETTKPIKVFNLPMKPWISITVQEGANDTRPVFGDESSLDIARLKKEFDQNDRSLAVASTAYMAYGMSKAGGIRIIRQYDGRDAKLFTDTKDRIFSLAISATPVDQNTTNKENIIGTGISGTVYWVQIKDGEKDHLEDTHPEQYGFALPPISAQEGGDAPGGILKTRARASTNHPEFFAVGRGKTIHIVWPSFVLERNLIKPGHDRLVDVDRLVVESSLKINTGKAGKDFTFSQDDTVIVSLDKSGRVKFWDVRDLTAADEGSGPRNPMPAHTSLEVKEPLMTLPTTPEGEKAWPTSVLLLDKLRPYQKRGALRYMIVGMKQNHTLQLWDLALRKPVQEFNLPHSKESDAVCSVNYHPPTGMIVVGHPTRNSIYFLHLSAPKYAMKSLSQVEYIQRLAAQDSVPAPESTAVISGMREYSYANKGTLRSSYLLSNPSSASDEEDATLFELYNMHSKGVACLMIKQAELGWDKDNKVVDGEDAIEAGIVVIEKLKSPPPPEPEVSAAIVEEVPLSEIGYRLAVRPKTEAHVPAAVEPTFVHRDANELVTPPKPSGSTSRERKETKEEQPTASTPQEKSSERTRGRKKKGAAEKAAAAAAAAAALADRELNIPQSNNANAANGNSPRVIATTSHKSAEASKASPSTTFSQQAIESRITNMENQITQSLKQTFQSEVNELRKKIDHDSRDRDEASQQRQSALLDEVSNVLNDNIQQVLISQIQDGLTTSVTPAVSDLVSKSVTENLGSKFNTSVCQSVQREMQRALPTAVTQTLQKPELVKAMTDQIVRNVSRHVDEELYRFLDDKIIPDFTTVATQAATAAGRDIMVNVSQQFKAIEQVRVADNQKMDQMIQATHGLMETITTMAASQTQMFSEVQKLRGQLAQQQQIQQLQIQQQTARQIEQGSQVQGGGGSHNSPAHSHSHSHSQGRSQAMHPVNPAVTIQQQQYPTHSSHTSVMQSQPQPPPYTSPSQAAITSPPHQQQSQQQQQNWGSASAIMSPPHQQQHRGSSGHSQALQAVNPNITALQHSQQYASSSGHTSQGSGQQQTQPQVAFQPTTKDNRERLEVRETVDKITRLMDEGRYDDAVMGWLQSADGGSPKAEAIFRDAFARRDPGFIPHLNSLHLLSAAATVTINLEANDMLITKLAWVEIILGVLQQIMPNILGTQVQEYAPSIMNQVKSRLEHVFLRVTQTQPNDPILKNLASMSHMTTKLTNVLLQGPRSQHQPTSTY